MNAPRQVTRHIFVPALFSNHDDNGLLQIAPIHPWPCHRAMPRYCDANPPAICSQPKPWQPWQPWPSPKATFPKSPAPCIACEASKNPTPMARASTLGAVLGCESDRSGRRGCSENFGGSHLSIPPAVNIFSSKVSRKPSLGSGHMV